MPIRIQTWGKLQSGASFTNFTGAFKYFIWVWRRLIMMWDWYFDVREQKVGRVCGGPFPPWESVFSGESDSSQQCTLTGVLLEVRKHGGKKSPTFVSSWGSSLFKRMNFRSLQCIPHAGERSKNRLWRFSHLVHWHPVGSAFPGSCQTRNFGMSFCRYF